LVSTAAALIQMGHRDHREARPGGRSNQLGKTIEHHVGASNGHGKDAREKLRVRIVQTLKDFDTFLESLSKIDEKAENSRLSRIVAGENVGAALKDGAYVLWLKAVAAGGAAHAKVSTFNSKLTYSGGAIASYAIFDNRGHLVEADTIPMYGGKVRVDYLPRIDLGLELYGDVKFSPDSLAAGTLPP
jgi:hypothetical protein